MNINIITVSYKGYYKIKNKSKYIGSEDRLRYRSRWELKTMRYLDNNDNITKWAYEPFSIPYYNPIKKRESKYWPDFLVETKSPNTDKTQQLLIEVKPLKETTRPIKPKSFKNSKQQYQYNRSLALWVVNKNKWEMAQKLCIENGWTFKILTEKHIMPEG